MQAGRLAQISCVCGLASTASFVGLVLFELFPSAPGHMSALFSAVEGLLFLMINVSYVLAPVALVTGIKALRRVTLDSPKKERVAAWVGVTTGGLYTAMMVLLLFVLAPMLWKLWLVVSG